MLRMGLGLTQPNTANTSEKSGTDNEIREYVTPASKRGAAISSTLSLIIILKALGAIPYTEVIRIPIINLPITNEAASILLPLMALIFFFMWGARYMYEYRYAGSVRQDQTQTLKAEVDYLDKGVSDGLNNIAERENTFKEQLSRSEQEFQAAFDLNHSAQAGYHVRLKSGKEKIGAANEQWRSLVQARGQLNEIQERRDVKFDSYKNRLNIDNGLNFLSQLGYVWAPISLFVAAITSPFWSNMPEVICLLHSPPPPQG